MFRDRMDAGEALGKAMQGRDLRDPVVLGLPRGGVVVAAGVARALRAPLDLIVVRKLGAPGNPELGIGAVAEGGVTVVNEALVRRLRVTRRHLDRVSASEHAELERRRAAYRGGAPAAGLDGRDAVVVDDGLATGYTARAAVESARRRGAGRVILAVPVAAPETAAEMEALVDDLVCIEAPTMMLGVGASYRDFRQTTDAEVMEALSAAAATSLEVLIPSAGAVLPGTLTRPPGATGLVLFAHGSGSSRHSPRNREVARALQAAGLGTLLFDLLTADEGADRRLVFDIPLLAARLRGMHDNLPPEAGGLPVGYFGSSTGAAAALTAAAGADDVAAIVSRGGRPDLADRLGEVTAPVLLIVGADDGPVVPLNETACRSLGPGAEMALVAGAGHLFEETGALEQVCELAAAWFTRWMR